MLIVSGSVFHLPVFRRRHIPPHSVTFRHIPDGRRQLCRDTGREEFRQRHAPLASTCPSRLCPPGDMAARALSSSPAADRTDSQPSPLRSCVRRAVSRVPDTGPHVPRSLSHRHLARVNLPLIMTPERNAASVAAAPLSVAVLLTDVW